MEDRRGQSSGTARRWGLPDPDGCGRRRARPDHHRRPRAPLRRQHLRRRRVERPPRPGRGRPDGAPGRSRLAAGDGDVGQDEGPGVRVRQVRQPGRAEHVDADLPAVRQDLHARAGRDVHLRHGQRLRPRVLPDRAVLLPCGPQGLPRPLVLPRAVAALRRAGRFRLGVRDHPRDRPPHPERARHRGGHPAEAAGGPRSCEPVLGAAGAAG